MVECNHGLERLHPAYIQPFGDIFINLLKLIAVPLVLFSIISGVTSLGNIQKLGRMGIKTLLTYVATTMAAVVIGLALVNVFHRIGADDDLLKANRIAMNSGATPTASKRWMTFEPSMTGECGAGSEHRERGGRFE